MCIVIQCIWLCGKVQKRLKGTSYLMLARSRFNKPLIGAGGHLYKCSELRMGEHCSGWPPWAVTLRGTNLLSVLRGCSWMWQGVPWSQLNFLVNLSCRCELCLQVDLSGCKRSDCTMEGPRLASFHMLRRAIRAQSSRQAFPVDSISLPQDPFVFAKKIMQSGMKTLPPGLQLGRLAKASGWNPIWV